MLGSTVGVEVQGSSAHPSSVHSDHLALALGGPSCHPQAEDRGARGSGEAGCGQVRGGGPVDGEH